MKKLLALIVMTLLGGGGQAPTQRQEIPPAGFKQVVIIDENGAHTVTIPAGNILLGPTVVPAPAPSVKEKSGYE